MARIEKITRTLIKNMAKLRAPYQKIRTRSKRKSDPMSPLIAKIRLIFPEEYRRGVGSAFLQKGHRVMSSAMAAWQ